MAEGVQPDLAAQLAAAEYQAAMALTRVDELQAEVRRLNEWHRITVGAVVAIAVAAILMFGIVAFKAIDSAADPQSGDGPQLTARSTPSQ